MAEYLPERSVLSYIDRNVGVCFALLQRLGKDVELMLQMQEKRIQKSKNMKVIGTITQTEKLNREVC